MTAAFNTRRIHIIGTKPRPFEAACCPADADRGVSVAGISTVDLRRYHICPDCLEVVEVEQAGAAAALAAFQDLYDAAA